MSTHSVVVHRVLSAEQAERRDRVIQAAMELADAGGYDAVVMKTVAERSGVALATLYRWFASKDHLLTEVLLAWGSDLSADLADAPLIASDPVARVSGALRQIMVTAASRPRLAEAIVAAVLTVEPAVFEAQNDFHTMVVAWIDIALGDDDLPDREEVVEVLELVCFSTIIGLVSGRDTAETAGDKLETAARLLIRTA
ncbi:MAG TPA: TetR/AcrR family transcriptional regulator [Acidimicrobiia bacterium]|nr:TetR/AcrR family transcriptional regulator [Acidimicrobiia bacterium]